VFCGDLLISGGTVWIPGDENGDLAAYLASLERLLALHPERAYPAHGPIIEEPARLIGNYIRHRYEREAQVLDALAHGDSTVAAMTTRIYRGLKEELMPLARHSVTAHLRKLAAEGRVQCTAEAWHIIDA
jgi:glyoxylase-like metal-dependent hydrolase (beta-lactamase superfamily II)